MITLVIQDYKQTLGRKKPQPTVSQDRHSKFPFFPSPLFSNRSASWRHTESTVRSLFLPHLPVCDSRSLRAEESVVASASARWKRNETTHRGGERENGAPERTSAAGITNKHSQKLRPTHGRRRRTRPRNNAVGWKNKTFGKEGETVFLFRRAATLWNMDTLFSRFLGLLLLLSDVGIVFGQMPTGKPTSCTNSTLSRVLYVVKGGEVCVCFGCLFRLQHSLGCHN